MTDILALRGPEFLVFFIAICIAVHVAVTLIICMNEERAPARRGRLHDPYMIAYLRGGEEELIRVVALSLTLRGLLRLGADGLTTSNAAEIDRVAVPIEKSLLEACRTPSTPTRLSVRSRSSVQDYHRRLTELGLLADDATRGARGYVALAGAALLALLAVSKIVVALQTGHSNIVLLIVVAALAILLLLRKVRKRLTSQGQAVLQDLSVLFKSLDGRSDTLVAGAVAEATLLAAVFGVYIEAGPDPALWRKVFPLPVNRGAGSYSGTTCGSGGCGGGSGCGGGGCGGCGS